MDEVYDDMRKDGWLHDIIRDLRLDPESKKAAFIRTHSRKIAVSSAGIHMALLLISLVYCYRSGSSMIPPLIAFNPIPSILTAGAVFYAMVRSARRAPLRVRILRVMINTALFIRVCYVLPFLVFFFVLFNLNDSIELVLDIILLVSQSPQTMLFLFVLCPACQLPFAMFEFTLFVDVMCPKGGNPTLFSNLARATLPDLEAPEMDDAPIQGKAVAATGVVNEYEAERNKAD